VHHRLTPREAAELGKRLEPFRLFWMEDATPAENQEAFNLIRQHTTTPLAVVGQILKTVVRVSATLPVQGPTQRVTADDYVAEGRRRRRQYRRR
jgi:hypothetical protein